MHWQKAGGKFRPANFTQLSPKTGLGTCTFLQVMIDISLDNWDKWSGLCNLCCWRSWQLGIEDGMTISIRQISRVNSTNWIFFRRIHLHCKLSFVNFNGFSGIESKCSKWVFNSSGMLNSWYPSVVKTWRKLWDTCPNFQTKAILEKQIWEQKIEHNMIKGP